MIKQLLSILAVASVVTVSAQTGKLVNTTKVFPLDANTNVQAKPAMPIITVTLSPLTGTSVGVMSAASDTQVAGCSPNAGYVVGSNCYDDLQKAQYFPPSAYNSSISPAAVTGAIVYFYKSGTEGTGGAPTQTVGLNIYSGTSNTVAPGALIGSTMTTMASILAAQSGTQTIFPFTYTLATPAPLSAGFFASITLPTTAGDTVVVATETANINNAWEQWSDNSWKNMQPAWGGSLKINLAIFPILTGSTTAVGISTNMGLSNKVVVMPNPTTGNVKVAFHFQEQNDLNINVTNALGQIIATERRTSVLADIVNLDLSNQPNGVYFVTVSNGKDKMVKRLIVNH